MEPRVFDLDLQLLADSALMIVAVFVLFLIASYLLFNPCLLYTSKVGINQALEKDVNLQIAEKLKAFLEAEDIRVVMTRETDGGLYDENAVSYTHLRMVWKLSGGILYGRTK